MTGAASHGEDITQDRGRVSIAIVIVNWNGFDDTCDCLESLARDRDDAVDMTCIVVDNGSSDRSAERLAAQFPWVRVVALGANMGYAAACNEGMRIALDEGMDLVVLLNNDAVVEPGCMRSMVAAAIDPRNEKYGLFTPIIVERGKPEKIWAAGGTVRLWLCLMGNRTSAPSGSDPVSPCDFATGCCVMARAEVIRSIGMLDAGLFAYAEDVDWSLRARRAGWRIGVVRPANVRHRISASLTRNTLGDEGGVTTGAQHYYNARNRYIMLRRYCGVGEIVSGTIVHVLRCAVLIGGQVLLGRLSKAAMTMRGVLDGVRMRTGQAPRRTE